MTLRRSSTARSSSAPSATERAPAAASTSRPAPSPDDGWLDVCTVADQPLRRIPFLLALSMRGRHGRASGVRMARARRITVTLGTPCAVHADGEVVTTAAVEVEARVLPSALHVLG